MLSTLAAGDNAMPAPVTMIHFLENESECELVEHTWHEPWNSFLPWYDLVSISSNHGKPRRAGMLVPC